MEGVAVTALAATGVAGVHRPANLPARRQRPPDGADPDDQVFVAAAESLLCHQKYLTLNQYSENQHFIIYKCNPLKKQVGSIS